MGVGHGSARVEVATRVLCEDLAYCRPVMMIGLGEGAGAGIGGAMTKWSISAMVVLVSTGACRGSVTERPSLPLPVTAGGLAAQPGSPACESVIIPVVGTLCRSLGAGRHPAIVLFGGSQGGDSMRTTAEDFSRHGYVALSVAYFGAPGTQPTLVDVPVETAGDALHMIAARDDVDADRIAVMGSSKGGEYALLAASTYPEAKAVVAVVPSPFAWFGLGQWSAPTGCSWSRGGKTLPCVPQDAEAGRDVWQRMTAHQPVAFRAAYEQSRKDGRRVEAAVFPIERIDGPVLCLAADDDQIWNSRVHCELAMTYLSKHEHPHADRMISYPDAGHLFLLARQGPQSARNSAHIQSFEMLFGGTPEGDARAATDAWAQIDRFLTSAFGPPRVPSATAHD
jgi:dienelactone hydrolase